MSPPANRGRASLGAALIGVALAACATAPPGPPASAEAARRELQQVVRERQPDGLWRLLDQRTREIWQIAWHARRAVYELVPLLDRDDVARDPELHALPPQPPPRAEDFFRASLGDLDWSLLSLDPKAPLIELGKDARVITATGERLDFRRGSDDTWGFAGLDELGRQAAQRELISLDRVGRLVAVRTQGLLPGAPPWR